MRVMRYGNIVSISGETVAEEVIDRAAENAVLAIMSELPKEAQTYDVLMYVEKRTKEKIKGMRITIKNE